MITSRGVLVLNHFSPSACRSNHPGMGDFTRKAYKQRKSDRFEVLDNALDLIKVEMR